MQRFSMTLSVKKAGFSLLELAIVLVVVGLVAGGLVVGRNMIRGAEMRSVLNDCISLKTAFFAFKDKYQAVPGDMKNATSFWGDAGMTSGNPYYCLSTQSGTATCNGDGDGKIGKADNTDVWDYFEWFYAFKHLQNAGLIQGSYTGAIDWTDYDGNPSWRQAMPGVNVPASKVSLAGYTFVYTAKNGWWVNYPGMYGNALWMGQRSYGNLTGEAFVTPEEAEAIDAKVDDGKPGTGTIKSANPNQFWWAEPANGPCGTDFNPALAIYDTTNSKRSCWLVEIVDPQAH